MKVMKPKLTKPEVANLRRKLIVVSQAAGMLSTHTGPHLTEHFRRQAEKTIALLQRLMEKTQGPNETEEADETYFRNALKDTDTN